MAFFPLTEPAIRVVGARPRAVKPKEMKPSDGTQAVLDAFTELAPEYEATMDVEVRQMWGISYPEFIDRLIDVVPLNEGTHILDVATGTAMIPRRIASRAPATCHITGLDITPAMLSCGRQNIHSAKHASRIRLICASGMEIAFGRSTFDVVTCGLGMHHMEASRLVSEMRRVLRPGGRLIMADVGVSPFWRSWAGRIGFMALMVCFGMTRSRSRSEVETDAASQSAHGRGVAILADWRRLR